jgi:hypothetical protein
VYLKNFHARPDGPECAHCCSCETIIKANRLSTELSARFVRVPSHKCKMWMTKIAGRLTGFRSYSSQIGVVLWMTVVQHVDSKVMLFMFMSTWVYVLIRDHRQPSFIMSVCLAIYMEHLSWYWSDFHRIWYLSVFCWENSNFSRILQE